jgi:hypothetical protein
MSENVFFLAKKSKNVEKVGKCDFFGRKSQKMPKISGKVSFWSKKSKNVEKLGAIYGFQTAGIQGPVGPL